MEELLLQIGVAGGVGGMMLAVTFKLIDLLVWLVRARTADTEHDTLKTKSAAEAEQREDSKDMAWITAITSLTNYLNANTAQLQALNGSMAGVERTVASTEKIMDGARYQMQQYVGQQIEHRNWLRDELPDLLAQKVDERQETRWGQAKEKLDAIALNTLSLRAWIDQQVNDAQAGADKPTPAVTNVTAEPKGDQAAEPESAATAASEPPTDVKVDDTKKEGKTP